MSPRIALVLLSLSAALAQPAISGADAAALADAREHLKHVVIIMQENRSFDTYFGTFPGADGLPRDAQGKFTTCVPLEVHDPAKGCVRPFHDTLLINDGGPHAYYSFVEDWDGGKMDGFVQQATDGSLPCFKHPNLPKCLQYRQHDLMGYHTDAEIPNYWAYARNYMLQDHLFEPVGQMSLGAHLMMTSEWVAHCTDILNPMSCITTTDPLAVPPNPRTGTLLTTPFAWTNLTWLLDHQGVSWKYYLSQGGTPDCDDQDDSDNCDPEIQNASVASIWNPLPGFTTFRQNIQANPQYAAHVVDVNQFYIDVAAKNLPAVSWIVPNYAVSEHPPASIVVGMNYVTSLVNTIMRSDYYNDTVIFIAWDDWGGFYDHVNPPVVDQTVDGESFGYGFRVPGLVISPYVTGRFDHQILSFDAYNRLIEDLFLKSKRLDPATDGRPDSRPNVREALTNGYVEPGHKKVQIGDLLNDFNFERKPIRRLVLSNTVER
jgi:phospholipase C